MFKSLVFNNEDKENHYKAIVDISFGSFRNHMTYRVFPHKEGYWRVLTSGTFVGFNELEKSNTKEEAFEKANEDYQNNLLNLYKALESLKI